MATLSSAILTLVSNHINGTGYTPYAAGYMGPIGIVFGAGPFLFDNATWSSRTDTAVVDAASLTAILNTTLHVQFDIEGTLFGDSVPYDEFDILDCYVTLTFSDASTYVIRPRAFVEIPNATGTVVGSLTGTDGSANGVLTRHHFSALGFSPILQLTAWDPIPTSLFPGWLIVNEPGLGLTDQTPRLFYGEGAQHSFNLQAKQRGQATYTLRVSMGDSYTPVRGSPIYLFDHTSSGWTLEFAGLIQDFTRRQIGNAGYFFWDVNAVSLESVFDTIYARPVQYIDKTCGFIVTDLFNRFEVGSQVTLGTIQDGTTIPLFNAELGVKLSDLFSQLATTSQFTWNVNPATQQLFFGLPSAVAAPFELTPDKALWDSISLKLNGADYRNRQAVKLSYDSFAHSAEFFVGAGQTDFQLMRPVQQVTNAWATLSTCNTAIGTFSGNPSPGDTVTVGVATEVWQATHAYALGGTLIIAGFVQKVTFAGTTGGTIPTFSTITGQTTIDGTVIWTCIGPAGISTGTDTYTFRATIDNTVFGDVLIGATSTDTCLHLVDAINANAITRGLTFSLPTWECSLCNAILNTGTGFTIQRKNAGSGWIAALSETSSAFSWSSAVTTGGTSPQGSLGPGEGATIVLQVYVRGTSTASPALYYTPGDSIVHLASPLNVGSNLNVEYTRADGNVIEVEDTALVNALALVTHGTGKYQQMVDQSTTGVIATSSAAGLQFAQQALAAFKVPPVELEAQLYIPGLLPGQEFIVNLTGELAIFNNTYFIEEIQAELVPVYPYMDSVPGAGHYRYTLHLIDIAQIGSYMDFWEGLGGGGSGGGQGSALVATSGGGLAPSPLTFPLDFSGQTLTTTIAAGDGFTYDLASFLNGTLNSCTFTGRFEGAIFKFATIDAGTYDGCDFSNCDFTSCVFRSSASFIGCNFTNCNFTNADFNTVNLSLSEFIGSIFSAASFATVNLSGSNFTACDFNNATFTGGASNCQGANFTGAQFLDATFTSTDFRGANFTGAAFQFATLTSCNCTATPGSVDTLFKGASFDFTSLTSTNFTNADLSGATFLNCYAATGFDATFTGANFTGTRFNYPAGTGSGITKYGGATGAVDLRAGNYTALPWDVNKLQSFSAVATLTLPATAPSSTWGISVQNYSAGVVTIGRNGRNIDGAAANVSLPAGTGIVIRSDGTNYFTERGLSSAALTLETSGVVNGSQTLLNLKVGAGLTISDDGVGDVTISTVPATAPVIRGSGITQSNSANTLTVTLPAGTVAGDFAVIFTHSGYGATAVSGWTTIYNDAAVIDMGYCAVKVLTSGDISTGSVTVNFGGSFDCTLAITTFIGATGGVREYQEAHSGGFGTATLTTSSAVLSTDAAVYFAGVRQVSSTITFTPGSGSATTLQSTSTTNSKAKMADQAMPGGALAVVYGYSGGATTFIAGQVIIQGVAGIGNAIIAGIQQSAYIYAADTGTANAYAAALAPVPTIVAGSAVLMKVLNANTTASTIAVNGGTATAIKKAGTSALASGDFAAGQIVLLVFDGTNWQWVH